MKIVFIEPRSSEANVYSKLAMPLLGPVYLGTILRDRGHEVTIYKEDICMPDYSKLEADVIGISILTSTAKRGYEIAKRFPREKVVIGGIHASLLPEEASQYARQVVIGEGENIIVDVIEGRNKDRLVYGSAVEDLDSLPFPDFSLIKGYRRASAVTLVSTSRGCPFDCSFCAVTKLFGRKYRFRSAESVIRELKLRRNNTLFFCDDNFAAHPKRTLALLRFMLGERLRNWACQVRCDVTKNDKLLGLMARAGCKVVCVGIESVNELSLKAYDKKQTVADISDSLAAFHKKKIKVHGMFVLGGDNDDTKTVWDTIRFARKHRIDTMQMCALTPFPGTKVFDELEKEGRIFTKDWSLYDGQHVVFKPKLISAKELQHELIKGYTKFYSLSRSIALLLKLRLRNAVFNLIGYVVIKDWKKANRDMSWLVE
ncbi:MAG: radical SAM protein [Candidatus Omnitrophota bacterium]|jgi:radical SAM superfamily enzyme YgiQ (UPF0313 family)|nr:MAG: radical SAM protein [Candidatus Omnitrophota bacterium]